MTRRTAESRALAVLRSKHSYMFFELRRDERETMIFIRDRKTGKSTLVPAVAIKLVVPANSELGKEIVAMRKKARPRRAPRSVQRRAA